MHVFFYDITVSNEEEDIVYLKFLDEHGDKLVVQVNNVRKYIYVLPANEDNAEWRVSLLRFMRTQTSSMPKDVVVIDVVSRRYIISENHALSREEAFLRLSCDARHDWNFNRTTIENCPLISNYLGGDHSVIEQLINEHKLHAWTVLNMQYLSSSSSSSSTINNYSCSASMLRHLIVSTGDTARIHPDIRTAIVYKDLKTDLYTVRNHNKKVTYSPLNECNARRMLSVVNPTVTIIHGTNTFVNHTLDYAGVVINTMDLDKISVDAKSIDDILLIAQRHKFIELSLDLTVYTWQPWSQTVRSTMRLARVEWLLFKRFFECNVLPPSKLARHVKEEYKGGLVLPASLGIHNDGCAILLFDFRSLYPSLCVEYSICWSDTGELLPAILKDLIEQRKALQTVPSSEIRRLVLKLLANTTYGCMAATSCRYYSPYIAERITKLSRRVLQDTADAVQASMATVIYGDTDSVFVKVFAGVDVKKYIAMFVSMINRRYRYLELEHEHTYRLIVFVSKKCYVAFSEDERLPPTIKGLKMIKSDYCLLGRYLVETIIKRLGRGRSAEHIFKRCQEEAVSMIDDLCSGRTPLSDVTMTRRLNKRINEYSSHNLPYHIEAALHDRKKTYIRGEYIRYVMIEGKKCICVENMNDRRKLDIQWYCSQIHGMVDQLLDMLPGYDASKFHEIFLSPSSTSTTTKKKKVDILDYHRHGLSIQCDQCNRFSVHYGLYNLEKKLLETDCSSSSSSSSTIVINDDSDTDEYDIDTHLIPEKEEEESDHDLVCKHCQCILNLRQALVNSLLLEDPWQQASLQLNYDCKRILSLTQCDDCRRRIASQLISVKELYVDLMKIIDH